MASVTKLTRDGRNGYRVRFYVEKRRRELYLAGVSKRVAEKVAAHCEELATAKRANVQPAAGSVTWANSLKGRMRESLVSWGLADPVSPRLLVDEGRFLGPFVDAYVASRTDWKPNTVANVKQVTRLLKAHFGERYLMRAITPGDADRWQRWLTVDCKLSVATVSKHSKRAKSILKQAVRDRLLTENPFAELKGGDESNPDRQRFITQTDAAKVSKACPDADWRLIFALCRYGGLRCPTEVLALRWTDIDWETERLRIDSVKTGLRFCPMFPELRVALSEAFELAEDGATYCVSRYRGSETNLRTQLHRIIERAGLVPWPKAFVNLRSTRRTELQEAFPSHVVNAWLGHSEKVAELHYLQVTDDHWGRAADFRPPTRPPVPARPEASGPVTEGEIPGEVPGSDGLGCVVNTCLVPPRGIEPLFPD